MTLSCTSQRPSHPPWEGGDVGPRGFAITFSIANYDFRRASSDDGLVVTLTL
jgi:hypothetical protein